MITTTIISSGHKPPNWVQEASQHYHERLKRHMRIQYIDLPATPEQLPRPKQQALETTRILSKIPAGSYVIGLDEAGKQLTSIAFSQARQKQRLQHHATTFIIGPTNGLSEHVKEACHTLWSLSSLTFTHDFVKVILLEQLFRAECIASGHPYHRP